LFFVLIRTTFAQTHLCSHPKAREAREAIAKEARVVFLYITKVVSRLVVGFSLQPTKTKVEVREKGQQGMQKSK